MRRNLRLLLESGSCTPEASLLSTGQGPACEPADGADPVTSKEDPGQFRDTDRRPPDQAPSGWRQAAGDDHSMQEAFCDHIGFADPRRGGDPPELFPILLRTASSVAHDVHECAARRCEVARWTVARQVERFVDPEVEMDTAALDSQVQARGSHLGPKLAP